MPADKPNAITDPAAALGGALFVEHQGKQYKLSELQIGDFASCANHLRSQRMRAFLADTRAVNGVNLPHEVRSGVMAAIVNNPIRHDEMLTSFEGSSYLLWCSMKRGGDWLGGYEQMLTHFPGDVVMGMVEMVCILSGLRMTKEESDGSRPTTSITTPTPTDTA